jgi:hypothetical protein
MKKTYCTAIILSSLLIFSCESKIVLSSSETLALKKAQANGILVNEGFERCRRFVDDWLKHADPETGLIPRNLDTDTDIWNAKDAAADNYPFMVLTAALTDQQLFEGRMLDMLITETRLTSRIGNMPDTYSFSKKGFAKSQPDVSEILFGASEYIKDGLLPLTEWLGHSPWSERMIAILDDIWKHAPVKTNYGNIVSTNAELNGEMLQVLSRVYWMTGEQKYVDWAMRLGDYYLLGDNHPTSNSDLLRLRDHGCEIVSGLCELYASVNFSDIKKKKAYQPHIYEMLDRILEVGRNEDGLFYNAINPTNGDIKWDGTADTFGYTFNAFYMVYQIDSIERYRTAILKGLSVLNDKYKNFDWEHGSSDGYADAIEGVLNLYAREPIPSAAKWIDSETQVMWSMQDSSHSNNTLKWLDSGIIEGWHGDGNFARTTIMYCLWKTQGMTVHPWRSDVKVGAVMNGTDLMISVSVEEDWQGQLRFDSPRHRTVMNMPFDWPRINQFPEWFTPLEDMNFELVKLNDQKSQLCSGEQLWAGIQVSLKKGVNQFKLSKS